jgi:chemotaxis signal transduction protein
MTATVVFELAEQYYGVSIDHVREIVPLMKVSQVPQMPFDWHGIAILRQRVTPIIDLRSHMRLPARTPDINDPIIVLQEGPRQLGILVDAISQILYDAQAAAVEYRNGKMIINLEVSTIFAKTPDIAEREQE